jgi:putative component of membrane protein insertase Oxa1/YidC/SpoIIIJ protein YidD
MGLLRFGRNDRRESARRAVICCGALLFASLFWVQTALADEALLRGPRKVFRAPVTAAGSSAAKEGALEEIASAPVRFYQRFLGPHWGRRCSYYPSCSNYALLAIRKHGALVGSIMAFDRLQHESNEARYSPLVQTGGEIRVYDPLENNDYWWYRAEHSEPEVSKGENTETIP